MRKACWAALRSILTILVLAGAAPAFADIASFNAAVKARDYKAASREAALTWPTLDKSRADIRLIAREFGYAAYLAGDYAAARGYSQAAVSGANDAAPDVFNSVSTILLRLSEFELSKTPTTRDALQQAMSARAGFTGFDNISQLGIEALVGYDLGSGKWPRAQVSAELGVKLLAAGGAAYGLQKDRMEMYSAVADYMATESPAIYDRLTDLSESIVSKIDAATTEAEAARFVPLYWNVVAWRTSIERHVYANGKKIDAIEALGKVTDRPLIDRSPRVSKLTHARPDGMKCQRQMSPRDAPIYPGSARYKGMIGTVIVLMDLGEGGDVRNPVVLAAAPEGVFGQAVLNNLRNKRFVPGEPWDKSFCQVETENFVAIFSFSIG